VQIGPSLGTEHEDDSVQVFDVGVAADPGVDTLRSLTPQELSTGRHADMVPNVDSPSWLLRHMNERETAYGQHVAPVDGSGAASCVPRQHAEPFANSSVAIFGSSMHPGSTTAPSADHSNSIPDYVPGNSSDAISDYSSSTMAPAWHGTWLQHGIHKPKVYTNGTVRYGFFSASGEPQDHHKALGDQRWKSAMDSEFGALLKNQTWHLVPPKSGVNAINCKWVYKIKKKSSGSINRYKAQLVAIGLQTVLWD
jgi:hypothetical protein